MILKGNQRAGGIDLATHLLNSFDNETVEIDQIRGTVARDLLGAFAEFEAIASGTRCKQPLYSLSINPPVPITRQQYQAAIDRIETELGLCRQPRAIIFHRKYGREHCHVVWSRIVFPTMKAIHLSHDHLKLQTLARALAAEFGLDLPDGLKPDPQSTFADYATADKTGVTPQQRRFEITEAYMASNTGQAFDHALAELGYTLARGDKLGFVVVDRYGHVHSLSRQISGARTKDIKARLDPISPDSLPSVQEIRKTLLRQNDHQIRHVKDRIDRKLRQLQTRRRAGLYREARAL